MKTFIYSIDPGNKENNWFKAKNIGMACALRLKLPTITAQLANYLSNYQLGSGPHFLSDSWKPLFQCLKCSKTIIYILKTTRVRGTQPNIIHINMNN